MAHTNVHHRRTHNLLLIGKLLGQRDAASPFTLVLDSLEQTARVLMKEYIRRAKAARTYTIFLAFETTVAPAGVDVFVQCYNKAPSQIEAAVAAAVAKATSTSTTMIKRHCLLLIDSLHPLCTTIPMSPPLQQQQNHRAGPSDAFDLTHFLSSLITPPPPKPSHSSSDPPAAVPAPAPPPPTRSLIAVYHADIPLPHRPPSQTYQPSPLTLLRYLATTILTLHPLSTLLAAQAAESRSLAPPVYGLDEGKEGVIVGLKPARFTRHVPQNQRGVVLELEHRRKSGRGVCEWYFLPIGGVGSGAGSGKENVMLLDDHPLFARKLGDDEIGNGIGSGGGGGMDKELAGLTFELGLTERQRVEREGVVLPYFDAQRDGGGNGPGEGGRILYDMGVEDDFDEEEDEI